MDLKAKPDADVSKYFKEEPNLESLKDDSESQDLI